MKLGFKEIDKGLINEVFVDDVYIGTVEADIWNGKWAMRPYFMHNSPRELIKKLKYDSFYKAGKAMAKLYSETFIFSQNLPTSKKISQFLSSNEDLENLTKLDFFVDREILEILPKNSLLLFATKNFFLQHWKTFSFILDFLIFDEVLDFEEDLLNDELIKLLNFGEEEEWSRELCELVICFLRSENC